MLSRYEKVNKIKSAFLRPTADNRINLTMDKIMPLNCNTYFYFRRKHTEKKKPICSQETLWALGENTLILIRGQLYVARKY